MARRSKASRIANLQVCLISELGRGVCCTCGLFRRADRQALRCEAWNRADRWLRHGLEVLGPAIHPRRGQFRGSLGVSGSAED